MMTTITLRFFVLTLCLCPPLVRAAQPFTLPLWPGKPPGDAIVLPPESNQTRPGDRLIGGRPAVRITNVSVPTITIYACNPAKNTGAAVMVCPGGGYTHLAFDAEGSEACEWLNSLGVTGILLKYRVPVREGRPRYAAPLEDFQRAIGLIRADATRWGINPARIGVLGFSAGGHLAALVGNQHDRRSYEPVDDADRASCRPNFVLLLYPAYLTRKEQNDELVPELPVSAATPPTFIVMAEDDPLGVENALSYYRALAKAKVPAELHVYPTGGHGFGIRRTDAPVTAWPDRAAEWMRASGWLANGLDTAIAVRPFGAPGRTTGAQGLARRTASRALPSELPSTLHPSAGPFVTLRFGSAFSRHAQTLRIDEIPDCSVPAGGSCRRFRVLRDDSRSALAGRCARRNDAASA